MQQKISHIAIETYRVELYADKLEYAVNSVEDGGGFEEPESAGARANTRQGRSTKRMS